MKIPLPEQIALTYSPANFGSRAIAYVCDFILRWSIICIFALFILYILLATESLQSTYLAAKELSKGSSTANLLLALAIVFIFFVEWSYPILFEVFRNGVSPGKQLVGLRVVDEGGLPITFSASFLRTALLIVDLLPATGLVALFFMASSKRRQRIGDVIARTVVIYDTEAAPLVLSSGEPKYALPAAAYDTLQEFVSRAPDLLAETRETIAARMVATFRRLVPAARLASGNTTENLRELLSNSYPSRAWPAEFDPRAARSWKSDIDTVNRSLLEVRALESRNDISHSKVRSIVQSYQDAAGVYAKWSTWFPNLSCSHYAGMVLRRGRMLLYVGKADVDREDKSTILERVHNSYDTVKIHCLASFLLCALGGLISWLAVAVHPEFGWQFLSEETAAQLQSGSIWTDSIKGMESIASAGIMTNNISVTINAFALGVTYGVGTVVLLVFNGVHLGGTFAALVPYGMAPRLLEFILAHGFLELSIIFVAGGCGLFLADGLIRPGHRTRKAALQRNARLSADLLVYSALWLILAGLVEGNISPNDKIHWGIKLLVGVTIGGLYWTTLIVPLGKKNRTSTRAPVS